jgi:hypothetical protein
MPAIAFVAMSILEGCAGELVERPPAEDPTSVAAAEAPFHRPPAYEADPLLSAVPPNGVEPSPTGSEQLHSPSSTPSGSPPMREEPGGRPPHHQQGKRPKDGAR